MQWSGGNNQSETGTLTVTSCTRLYTRTVTERYGIFIMELLEYGTEFADKTFETRDSIQSIVDEHY